MIAVNLLPQKYKIVKISIPENKLCPKCGLNKKSNEFKIRTCKTNSGSYTYLSSYCKECSKDEEKIRIKKYFSRPLEERIKDIKEAEFFNLGRKVKWCTKCGDDKDILEFSVDLRCWDRLNPWCNSCRNIVHKNQRINSHDYVLKRDKKYRDSYSKQYLWVDGTFKNHRKNGYTLNFSKKELIKLAENIKNCMFCGRLLLWEKNIGSKKPNSPSLENLYLKKELNIDDITIICCDCNTTKSNKTLDYFFKYCEHISENENIIWSRIKNQNNILKENV